MDRVVFISVENKSNRPFVDNATEHAYKLRQQADYLKKLVLNLVIIVVYWFVVKDWAYLAQNIKHSFGRHLY